MLRSIFQLPTRVSRLYPIFALILLCTSGIFFYAWQITSLELSNLPDVEQKNKTLEAQLEKLTEEQKLDKATLQVQKQKITDTATQLAELEKQLRQKTDEIVAKEQQIQNQQDQLTKNTAEIEKLRSRPPLFSFQNKSSLTDIAQRENDVRELVTNAYSYIKELYGDPYLLNSITITFVDEFTIAGSAGEIIIENSSQGIKIDIHLKDFDKNSFQDNNTVIHEIIHGFKGVAVFDHSVHEEGMTVAAADAVMKKMIADGKLPAFSRLYLNVSDEQYDQWNETLTFYANNEAFYSYPQVAKVYQVAGRAWYRLYEEDPEIFKKINAAYYPKVQKGLTPDTALVLDAIRGSIKSVGGVGIDTYLATNKAFTPTN